MNTQLGGIEPQLGKAETAVAVPSLAKGVLLAVGVGVPLASGMAGSGVLVGVAFKLAIAWATGEGKIWRWRLSNWASNKARSTVKKTLPVINK